MEDWEDLVPELCFQVEWSRFSSEESSERYNDDDEVNDAYDQCAGRMFTGTIF